MLCPGKADGEPDCRSGVVFCAASAVYTGAHSSERRCEQMHNVERQEDAFVRRVKD